MESDLNSEIESPAKRRKVEMDFEDKSTNYPLSPRFDDKLHCTNNLNAQLKDFSSSDYIESKHKRTFDQVEKANKILLFTVINPSYPITCDILSKICSTISSVVRIVIFRKNGLVQALIEYESMNDAKAVKDNLHGCDIYSGCCTLKIEFSRNSNSLNVYKNDEETWDFTKDIIESNSYSKIKTDEHTRRVLLEAPIALKNKIYEKKIGPFYSFPEMKPFPIVMPSSTKYLTDPKINNLIDQQKRGSVCIVYGLNMKEMNVSRMFNLFCLYGNVKRIKFLKTKEGSALIQMSDFIAVERVVSLLHNISLFGSNLNINCSKQSVLSEVSIPYQLADGTLSFQDFSNSNLNRFSTTKLASKNRVQRPANALHFYNAPPNIENSDIVNIFENGKNHLKVVSVKIFPTKSPKSSSGLVAFDNIEQALEALVIFNHLPVMSSSSKYPYIMKLCFSTSSVCSKYRNRNL